VLAYACVCAEPAGKRMQLKFVPAVELLTIRSAAVTYTSYHGTQTGLGAKWAEREEREGMGCPTEADERAYYNRLCGMCCVSHK